MAKAKTAQFYGTGRRKKSIARVYLTPGTGNITINKRNIDEYFGLETLKVIVRQPLVATNTADKYDIVVTVRGGGYTGQAGAVRHGISRALLQADADFIDSVSFTGEKSVQTNGNFPSDAPQVNYSRQASQPSYSEPVNQPISIGSEIDLGGFQDLGDDNDLPF